MLLTFILYIEYEIYHKTLILIIKEIIKRNTGLKTYLTKFGFVFNYY